MEGYWSIEIFYKDGDNIYHEFSNVEDCLRTLNRYSKYEHVSIEFNKFSDPDRS